MFRHAIFFAAVFLKLFSVFPQCWLLIHATLKTKTADRSL